MTYLTAAMRIATAIGVGGFAFAATTAFAQGDGSVVLSPFGFSPFGFARPVYVPRVSMVSDWSSRHVIFPDNPAAEVRDRIRDDPRFRMQNLRRQARQFQPDWRRPERDRNRGRRGVQSIERDWSVTLGSGNGGSISAPAKYVFDVNAAPNCTNDYVVTGINIAGSSGQANLIGFTSLYRTAAGNGICGAANTPNVKFAYNIGGGTVRSYVALSLDGTKVAFIESAATSYFHVLTLGTTGNNGTSATAPVVPGGGVPVNNAVDTKIALSGTGQTQTAPFVDYNTDTAYVTGRNSVVHKFTGVFNGTPTEVLTGGWPVSTGLAANSLSTPVYDSVTKRVFFTTASGTVRYVQDGPTASFPAASFAFATATITAAPVTVDSGNGKIYAYATNPSGANPVVAQADTALTTNQVIVALGSMTSAAAVTTLMGDFNEAYYNCTGNPCANARLYVVGNGVASASAPRLYAVRFGTYPTMDNTTGDGPVALSNSAAGNANASPVTAFYNSTTNTQYLFIGVSRRCQASGITGGCIRSINVGTLAAPTFPTAGTINNVILAASGGTGGISVDNVSTSNGAASVYYTTLTGTSLVKASQSSLN